MKQPAVICCADEGIEQFFHKDAPGRNSWNGIIFILTTAGKGIIEIDKQPYTLEPGTLISILPAHLLQFTGSSPRFNYLCLAYEFDFMNDFPFMLHTRISEKMDTTPFISITAKEKATLHQYYSIIQTHYSNTTHASYQEILRSLLFVFVAEVCHIYTGKGIKPVASQYEKTANDFFQLLHAHVRTRRDVLFYADTLCITSKHLAKIIKQTTGNPPSFWIDNFTIKEAKTILRSSDKTITQLSDELNFPNSSFFARYFKHHTGMAPLEYREKK